MTGHSLHAKKVLRLDQTPNEILKVIMPKKAHHLEQIFNNFLALGYYSAQFKKLVIIILCKLEGNKNYTNPKNYCSISFLNILEKIIEAIIAAKISNVATTYKLLPITHFESRCGSYIKTAIHHLLKKIYLAWNKNKIVFLLMMDVSATYLNILHKHLFHNLQKRKIDSKVVDWIALFLINRHTIVKTNKRITLILFVNLGLPQRSPLFSIFYLFYNRNIFDNCAIKRVDAQGYINDITLIAIGRLVKSNC